MIDRQLCEQIAKVIEVNDWQDPDHGFAWTIPGKGKFLPLEKASSKDIRLLINERLPICLFKSNIVLTPCESINYFTCVNKLTSVAHKNIILRALHGDIYTNERLFRFGMIDDPQCDRCEGIDTLQHRLGECPKVHDLFTELCSRTNRLRTLPHSENEEITEKIFAIYRATNKATLTIHAEALKVICSKSELLNPVNLVDRLIRNLIKRESGTEIINDLKTLLRN